MGLPEERAHCALRCSLGADTTREQIARVLDAIREVLRESLHMVRFSACR
jgi:cysteine sulfinate desulfinase/cysteine desulfurase-like protein